MKGDIDSILEVQNGWADMAFSEDQKSTIREIAYEVAKAISAQIKEDRAKDLELHRESCPVAKEVERYKAEAGGFIAAFTLIGGLLGAATVFIARHLWNEMMSTKP